MTIDDHIKILTSYHNGFTGQVSNIQDSIDVAVDIMRKYKKIARLINQAEYAGENSCTGECEWILVDKTYRKIQEILKDGNDD